MSGVWLMTSAMVSGWYSMVPGPPLSLQLPGSTVLVISRISDTSVVFDRCLVTPTLSAVPPPKGLPPEPDPAPAGVPGCKVFGPVTGGGIDGAPGRFMVAPATGVALVWLRPPESLIGVT